MEPTKQTYLYVTRQLNQLERTGFIEECPQQLLSDNKWYFLLDQGIYQETKEGIDQLIREPSDQFLNFQEVEGFSNWAEMSHQDLLYIRWLEVLDWLEQHPGVMESIQKDQHPYSMVERKPPPVESLPSESVPKQEPGSKKEPKPKPTKSARKKKPKKGETQYGKLDLFE